jgi:DNA-binding beta-propeller fold protein YncE
MRKTSAVLALLVLATACGALGAEPRAQLLGPRTASEGAAWRATLVIRPAPRVTPRVVATVGGTSVAVRVRPAAGPGRYALAATFGRPGRWTLAARIGAKRHALGHVAVGAAPIRLASVLGIALHPDGSLLVADGAASRIVRLDLASGRLTRLAAPGLSAPTGIDVARDGTVYVADRHARAVFRIRAGTTTRFAEYPEPLDVAVDAAGEVFVTGRGNTVLRIAPATGSSRYAGTGADASAGDGGPALEASLASPHGIAVDPNGDVVVAELASVRRIERATNVIRTIAGSGERRLCRERGRAREVCLTAIRVAFAPDGDLWVADPENSRLWQVADGEAVAHDLGFPPLDVAVLSPAAVLVADDANRRVRRFDVATGAVTTVAG